jgi:hypothetical protein
MPTTGDYDPTFIYFCILMYLVVVMLVLYRAVTYCVSAEPDLEIVVSYHDFEKSHLDVAYDSTLMMYEGVRNDVPPSYIDTAYGSIRLVLTERPR